MKLRFWVYNNDTLMLDGWPFNIKFIYGSVFSIFVLRTIIRFVYTREKLTIFSPPLDAGIQRAVAKYIAEYNNATV